jgi:hypothetical protein
MDVKRRNLTQVSFACFLLNFISNVQNVYLKNSNFLKKHTNIKIIFILLIFSILVKPQEQISARLQLNKLSALNNDSNQSMYHNNLANQTQSQQQTTNSIAKSVETNNKNRLVSNGTPSPRSRQQQQQQQQPNLTNQNRPEYSKDYTNDLFHTFERNTLFNNLKKDSISSSLVDNSVTEARYNNFMLKKTFIAYDELFFNLSYVGNVKIHEVNKHGYYIRLLNVSSSVDEDLSNYTIQQMVSTMPVAVYRLPSPVKLAAGHTLTIWSRTDEVEQQPPHTFVWNEQDKWGTGPECTTILTKPNGQVIEFMFLLKF